MFGAGLGAFNLIMGGIETLSWADQYNKAEQQYKANLANAVNSIKTAYGGAAATSAQLVKEYGASLDDMMKRQTDNAVKIRTGVRQTMQAQGAANRKEIQGRGMAGTNAETSLIAGHRQRRGRTLDTVNESLENQRINTQAQVSQKKMAAAQIPLQYATAGADRLSAIYQGVQAPYPTGKPFDWLTNAQQMQAMQPPESSGLSEGLGYGSAALGIAGLVAAPFTFGGSLALTAGAMGTGLAADYTQGM